MTQTRQRMVTVSSIVGRSAYQKGVKDGYYRRPLVHPPDPVVVSHKQRLHPINSQWAYERGRFVGHYLRNTLQSIPKNRIGPKVNPEAIDAFVEARKEGYML